MDVALRYNGFLQYQRMFADERDYCKRVLKSETIGNRTRARKQLDFLARFPPERPHDRLVGHLVEIYRVINPKFSKRGIAVGELEKVLSVDLGEEALAMWKQRPFEQEVLEEGVVIPSKDGTYIEGNRKREILPKSNLLREAEKYLEIKFSFNDVGFDYDSGVKPEEVLSLPPLHIHVAGYVRVDGHDLHGNWRREAVVALFNQEGVSIKHYKMSFYRKLMPSFFRQS